MKVFRFNRLISVIWVVLTILVFSTLSLTIVAIVDRFEKEQPPKAPAEVVAWSGSGTESNPYQISTLTDLTNITSHLKNNGPCYGKYFKLMNDIDANNAEIYPIGVDVSNVYVYSFGGIFDGGGYVISNLKLKQSKDNYSMGLFSVVGYKGSWDMDYTASEYIAQIKNLKLKNISVSYISSSFANPSVDVYVGGLVGTTLTAQLNSQSIGVSVNNCIVEGLSVSANGQAGAIVCVSGLVGNNETFVSQDNTYSRKLELKISNCMVTRVGEISVSGYTSHISLISPAYATYTFNVSPSHKFFYKITDCFADTLDYYTIYSYYDYAPSSPPYSIYNTKNISFGDFLMKDSSYKTVENVYAGNENIVLAFDHFSTQDSYWTCYSDVDNFGYNAKCFYLKSYTTTVTLGSDDESMTNISCKYSNTVCAITNHKTKTIIPKDEDIKLEGAKLSYFYFCGDYMYTVEAGSSGVSIFQNWTVTGKSCYANYDYDSSFVTFKYVPNGSYVGVSGSKDKTVEVVKDALFEIFFQADGKQIGFRINKASLYRFTPDSGYIIDHVLVNGVKYSSADSLTLLSNNTVEVVLRRDVQTWDTQFK